MNNTIMGECYFRVSKHLGEPISTVLRKKFTPDYKLLINKYFQIIVAEQEQQEEYEKELEKTK